jgi:hypothetical protein
VVALLALAGPARAALTPMITEHALSVLRPLTPTNTETAKEDQEARRLALRPRLTVVTVARA